MRCSFVFNDEYVNVDYDDDDNNIVQLTAAHKRPVVRKTFALIFVRSSGSTLLCSLLNQQPGVVCHDEYIG
jgi:hypothetical protein